MFNNAANIINSNIPPFIDSLWNRTDSTIIPQNIGDAYILRIDFTAETNSNDGYATLAIDIGGDLNIIVSDLFTFPKGANIPEDFSKTYLLYTLDTFKANGGKVKVIGGNGTTSLYNVDFIISRVYNARIINIALN